MNWPIPKLRLLPALYLVLVLLLPRIASLILMNVWMAAVAGFEFLRRRRPEVGLWAARHEIPEDFFWMTLGVWLTLVIFSGERILMVALGFVAWADPAATLIGRKWGKHPWPRNPLKTIEGSAGFFLISVAWSLLYVKPLVAVLAGAAGAAIEAHPWRRPWRVVFVLPCLGTLILSILNMVLGR